MSSINAMRISQLGNCADIWSCLHKNQDPQYTFGGFRLNLRDLKQNMKDTAVLSAAARTFLEQSCVLADPSQNPFNQTITELYDAEENIDLIFDPISSEHLLWLGRSTDNDTAPERSRAFYRAEVLQMLQANVELQQRLIRRLIAKQRGYANGWTHFRSRVEDFWVAVAQECLGENTDARIYDPSQADLLDNLYFTNPDNLKAYRSYLYTTFEDPRRVKRPLSTKIEAVIASLDILANNLPTQEKAADPAQWKAFLLQIVASITAMWSELWPVGNGRIVFDCTAARRFWVAMNNVENLPFDRSMLLHVQKKSDSESAILQINTVRNLLIDASNAWRELVIAQPADPSSAVDSVTFKDILQVRKSPSASHKKRAGGNPPRTVDSVTAPANMPQPESTPPAADSVPNKVLQEALKELAETSISQPAAKTSPTDAKESKTVSSKKKK